MNNTRQDTTSTGRQLRRMLLLAGILGLAPGLYAVLATSETLSTEVFCLFTLYIVTTSAFAYHYTNSHETLPITALIQRKIDINRLADKYNQAIGQLIDSYREEKSQLSWINLFSKEDLRGRYSSRYRRLEKEYQQEQQSYLQSWEHEHVNYTQFRSFWGWLFVIGICSAVFSCGASLSSEIPSAPASALAADATTYWNAENIPIPHLQDATQYVSNPDHVLSSPTVEKMNKTLQLLDKELGIESVFIIVNHIENDDPFRMAQDVGNRYGVGRGDRGLMVVVGYLDRSINMSPGKALEADLTDVECRRLEQQYVVPGMKAGMPDSAMLYLTDAVYSTLKKKELPQMSNLMETEEDDSLPMFMGLYLLFFIGWTVFFLRLNNKYQWLGLIGATALIENPFYQQQGGGGFSSGGGFGGGGFSSGGGGSFGGGSFGGGGATSRW